MRLRHLLACLGCLLLPSLARAQILSVYATYAPTHFGNVQTGSVYSSGSYSNQFTSFTASGIGGGLTFGALPIGPVRLGLDLRGSTKSGTTGFDTGLVGLKVAVKLPLVPFKPYVQASGGYVATRTANVSTGSNGTAVGGTFTNQYAAYEILGGVDYHFVPFIDLRLIELGGGKGYNTGITFSGTTQNVSIFTVNTGVVVHF